MGGRGSREALSRQHSAFSPVTQNLCNTVVRYQQSGSAAAQQGDFTVQRAPPEASIFSKMRRSWALNPRPFLIQVNQC
jgi:hypothetical protein